MKVAKAIMAETKPTDAEAAGLSGPVKEVKQICYKARRGSSRVEKGKIHHSNYGDSKNYFVSFNEAGNKTEEQVFSQWSRSHKIYDDRGLLLEDTHYYLPGLVTSTPIMSKTTKKYDAHGNELENINYDGNGNIRSKIFSQYDDKPKLKQVPGRSPNLNDIVGKGNMIENVGYNAKGEIISKSFCKFNDQGLMIENGNVDAKGVTRKVFWKYDDKANLIELTQYADEVLTTRTTNEYQFDKHGKKIGYTTINYSTLTTALSPKSVFKCNDHGDVVEVHHYAADGSLTDSRTIEREYDEDGNLIMPYNDEDDDKEKLKSETEECENDKHGNWVKKTTYYTASNSLYKKIPVNLYLREITYWGEESPNQKSMEEFFADIKTSQKDEKEDEDKNPMEELTPEQLKWMAEASSINDPFPLFRYYALTNKEMPSLLTYSGPYIEAEALLDELKENLDVEVIYSYHSIWNQQNETLVRYVVSFPGHPGFLLYAPQISPHNADEYEIPTFMTEDSYDNEVDYVCFSQLQLLRPSEASGKLDDDYGEEASFERELNDYINKCTLKKKPEKPVINMIEVSGNGFSMVEHAVDDDFEIKDLNVNYGYGFTKFHNELMERFNTSTKGLVLFHGQPGTGKTYYIRHLLRKMASGKKVVIYMPPNMVDHLVEPSFMTFLTGEVKEWSKEGHFCVLLIEDAEPLLAKRQEGVRIQGVTNLLNMTDGLLNDMLNLQIICTFNVDLRKLDSALLRPGRLIARKEFKALSELDANLLAQRLGIKHTFKRPATLGEIYALRKNQNTLIHDVEPDKDASSQIDDLL